MNSSPIFSSPTFLFTPGTRAQAQEVPHVPLSQSTFAWPWSQDTGAEEEEEEEEQQGQGQEQQGQVLSGGATIASLQQGFTEDFPDWFSSQFISTSLFSQISDSDGNGGVTTAAATTVSSGGKDAAVMAVLRKRGKARWQRQCRIAEQEHRAKCSSMSVPVLEEELRLRKLAVPGEARITRERLLGVLVNGIGFCLHTWHVYITQPPLPLPSLLGYKRKRSWSHLCTEDLRAAIRRRSIPVDEAATNDTLIAALQQAEAAAAGAAEAAEAGSPQHT